VGTIYLLIFRLCRFGCLQIPAHCIYWNGCQLPLCSRCLGVLLGAILFTLYFFRRKQLPFSTVTFPMILVVPMVVDGFLQISNLAPWSNAARFLTGVLFACGAINLPLVFLESRSLGLTRSDLSHKIRLAFRNTRV